MPQIAFFLFIPMCCKLTLPYPDPILVTSSNVAFCDLLLYMIIIIIIIWKSNYISNSLYFHVGRFDIVYFCLFVCFTALVGWLVGCCRNLRGFLVNLLFLLLQEVYLLERLYTMICTTEMFFFCFVGCTMAKKFGRRSREEFLKKLKLWNMSLDHEQTHIWSFTAWFL